VTDNIVTDLHFSNLKFVVCNIYVCMYVYTVCSLHIACMCAVLVL
jgi:hypothetical protein